MFWKVFCTLILQQWIDVLGVVLFVYLFIHYFEMDLQYHKLARKHPVSNLELWSSRLYLSIAGLHTYSATLHTGLVSLSQ